MAWRGDSGDIDESADITGGDHLVMKPSGVGSSRNVYTTEYGWQVIDFLVDSHGCVLLFEINWHDEAARLRVLSFRTTSTKTRDLGHIDPEFPVCVQITEF